MRGVGGLVFDALYKSFTNELGRRGYVTREVWKTMKFCVNGAKLAEDMGVPLQTLVDETEKHFQAAKKTEKDPDGGSWPAYPSGKS